MSQDGTEHGSAGAEVQDLSAQRERMAVIKGEVTAEVEAKWVTPYRNQDVFDMKVNSRLAAHSEYRKLQAQVREAETVQRASSDKAVED